jgi:hypothetical protein
MPNQAEWIHHDQDENDQKADDPNFGSFLLIEKIQTQELSPWV